ncbi:sigma-70 family RNA polymerase sigma factor [Myxococcota bacterium]|nr:sigma-70 family RNA polymerase sigma factor [Myxococcota bacterium]MBU1412593.1 sigma-70 family RNA polymerase sigma factor [Myxococcota bacterium]MBU1511021.1 sigma-70 family RNA polymerase sigma factor [Myxococcota bacterium]
MAKKTQSPVEKVFKKMAKAAAPDGAIAPEAWLAGIVSLDGDEVQHLIQLLEDDGYFVVEDQDMPDPDDTDDDDPGPSGDEDDGELAEELEKVLSTESFPHYNEHGILTREREFELANIMFHGKKEAIVAALSVRCVEDIFSRILQFVLRQNGRVWQYFEDPRDESAGESSMVEVVENLTVLLRQLESTGEKLSAKAQEAVAQKDPDLVRNVRGAIRRLIMRRSELMEKHVQYALRNEFFDDLGVHFQAGLDDLARARSKKTAYVRDFIERYGADPETFTTIANDYFQKVEDFQKARENLVLANQRLVIFFARKYQEQGVDLADLIGEGNIGLLRAVERFDPTKGSRLATYATWWIKHTLNRAVACQGATIRIPGHVREEKNRILRVMSEMTSVAGTEPPLDEVAKKMGLDPARIHGILQRTQSTISIDKPLGNDEDEETLQKILPDAEVRTPEEEVSRHMDFRWLEDLLLELSPRERKILELRYGLHGQEVLTLQEVGEKLEITRERVRQLQTKAESKIFKMARKLGYK